MPVNDPSAEDGASSAGNHPDAAEREREAARRRRLAAAFGDVLPEGTSDERDEAWGDRTRRGTDEPGDEWLRRQVPPHHG